jgi:hypothetical protein
MSIQHIKTLVLFIAVIFLAGCVSSPPETNIPIQQTISPVTVEPVENIAQPEDLLSSASTQTPASSKGNLPSTGQMQPSSTNLNKSGKATTMEAFVTHTFPQVTELYVAIKKSKDALEYKVVQDKSLQLQVLIQNIKQDYQLTVTNPEKRVFPSLDNRQQVVFLKYLQFLNDMENYAVNLKSAVYYQEKATDAQSMQTSKRYQSQADQYIKQAIAKVKTIYEYCQDFKYTFFNPELVKEYRYVE